MKTIYTQEEIDNIAFDALEAAVLCVQEKLGQQDGDVAGLYFTGENETAILSILKSYIQTEINLGVNHA